MLKPEIYKDCEIRIAMTKTGYEICAYRNNKPLYPKLIVDYETDIDMSMESAKRGLEELRDFMKRQIDKNLLLNTK